MFFLLFVTSVATALGAFDCQKPSLKEANICCNIEGVNWEALPFECSKYKPNWRVALSPCTYECVFNVMHIIKNEKIEIAALHQFVKKFISQDDAVRSYITSFEKCGTLFNEMLSKQSGKNKNSLIRLRLEKSSSKQQCSPLALKLFICASKEVFINCPAKYWTASPTCAKLKEIVRNCYTTSPLKRNTDRSYSSG